MGVYFLVLMDYYSNPLNTFFCVQKKETNKFFPVKIFALTNISKDVIYLSHSNSIKKLLNIKEKNFKITKVSDEDIKGIITKVVYAVASKKNAKCPC
ncbi:hypothetical protein, partial [Fusobacterium russii]|uniref:hypothetical protein n=1 Tax=Fusobacterium russii TaxID=854 RepID=UPI00047683F0